MWEFRESGCQKIKTFQQRLLRNSDTSGGLKRHSCRQHGIKAFRVFLEKYNTICLDHNTYHMLSVYLSGVFRFSIPVVAGVD